MSSFAPFLLAATLLAVIPGPGLLFVFGRTISGGREHGLHTVFGTMCGGMVHVLAGAIGLSAVLMASAEAFTIIKLAGAAYLLFLAIHTWRTASKADQQPQTGSPFLQGFRVEATNPKTALFFLALIPQFISQGSTFFTQYLILGTSSMVLNATSAVTIVFLTAVIRRRVIRTRTHVMWAHRVSALFMGALGASFLFVRRLD